MNFTRLLDVEVSPAAMILLQGDEARLAEYVHEFEAYIADNLIEADYKLMLSLGQFPCIQNETFFLIMVPKPLTKSVIQYHVKMMLRTEASLETVEKIRWQRHIVDHRKRMK